MKHETLTGASGEPLAPESPSSAALAPGSDELTQVQCLNQTLLLVRRAGQIRKHDVVERCRWGRERQTVLPVVSITTPFTDARYFERLSFVEACYSGRPCCNARLHHGSSCISHLVATLYSKSRPEAKRCNDLSPVRPPLVAPAAASKDSFLAPLESKS
ncbi:hypothetical protein T440DRAFT_163161 [Plenodomus tracheiphilus IPT5]|uniref:Uncharacterized protein n=1 Tax=Plenodomus tracheiphilus IPT5 TaxID=1408161 RepID=A0A6A7BMP9_9PLEO|nr:hypothetical protein T440DRAFT_163161 [Plenodomus tracheiphilus IPT5]